MWSFERAELFESERLCQERLAGSTVNGPGCYMEARSWRHTIRCSLGSMFRNSSWGTSFNGRTFILFTLILSVVGNPEVARASDSDRRTPVLTEESKIEISRHFSKFEGRQPGYAVGIVEDGNLAFARGFGSASLEHDIPIGPATAFNIASLSKQFTAAALGVLILREQVSLDAPVSQYLEEWPAPFQSVQVQHLVYMTSGLPEYYRLERSGGRDWGADYFTVEDALTAVMAHPDLEFAPGSQWAYSNTNYQVIAEIVARVSGDSAPTWSDSLTTISPSSSSRIWERATRPDRHALSWTSCSGGSGDTVRASFRLRAGGPC